MNDLRSCSGFVAIVVCLASTSHAVTIQYVPVGNPGNLGDTVVSNDGTTGYGAVPYAYSIGAYDVTNAQYAEFLNKKDPDGANLLSLWNIDMKNGQFGGISFNALNGSGSKYTVISGRQNHPVNYVTWYDAIRFANWLNNGQLNSDTENGAYTLGALGADGVPRDGSSIARNAGAKVFLPSENEWYKAAYYNPGTSSYFQYPTSSNTAPIASSPGSLANHANFFPGGPFNLTDVGAYSGTTSPYGAFDMGGNVIQWNEDVYAGSFRGLRGGSFAIVASGLLSSVRDSLDPTDENIGIGFRVATVPEPGSIALCGLGAIGLLGYVLRRHRAA